MVKGGDPSPLLSIGETHVECWIQVWAAQYKKGTDIPEQAHQRATDIIKGLKHLSYKETLRELGWFNLEKRRLKGDLIDVYKYLIGKSKENR